MFRMFERDGIGGVDQNLRDCFVQFRLVYTKA
jgi:hypothetical protein